MRRRPRAPFRLLPTRTPRQRRCELPPGYRPRAPTDLAVRGRPRRSMRLFDFCHPTDLRAPAPRSFPLRSRRLRAGEDAGGLWLPALTRGSCTFHDVMIASASHGSASSPSADLSVDTRHGSFRPVAYPVTEPLTLLSRGSFTLRLERLRTRCLSPRVHTVAIRRS